MRNFLRPVFILILVLFVLNIKAQVGTEFWFAAPDVTSYHGDSPVAIRLTAFDVAATVTISMPARNKVLCTIQVPANTQKKVDFTHGGTYDLDSIENSPVNTVNDKGILITSTADISAYYDETNGSNPDRFTLKGENALGTEFYISSQYDYENVSSVKDAYEQVNIVATEDGTTVKITPNTDIVGHNAGVEFSIKLNKGETYMLKGNKKDISYTLSGTHIVSNKNIAVTISDDSVYDNGAYDLIGDQTIPVSVCGTQYIAMFSGKENILSSDGKSWDRQSCEKVYILATSDNTTVNYYLADSTPDAKELNAGQSISLDIDNLSSIYIVTSAPVYVYQMSGLYKSSDGSNELGSAILPPIKCTGSSSVSFARVLDQGFYVQILTQKKNLDYFFLDGEALSSKIDTWTAVPGTDNGDDTWYFTNQSFSEDEIGTTQSYRLTNTQGLFHLSIFDENSSSASFGYFSSFNSLAISGIADACEGDAVTLTATDNYDSYEWHSKTSKDKVLSNESVLEVTESDKYWVVGVRDADGSESCVLADTIDVQFEAPEFTLGTDMDICSNETYTITPDFSDDIDSTNVTFEWVNGTDVSTENSYTVDPTTASVVNDTIQVILTVSNEDNCSFSDTLNLIVLPDVDISFDLDLTSASLCYGSKLSNTTKLNDYKWRFGSLSGTVISKESSVNVYNTGWYYLTATSDKGCTDSDSIYVKMIDLPEIALNDTTLCHEATYTSPTYTDSYTYEWTTKYSDDTSNSSSISFSESKSDSLYVMFKDKSTGCINYDTAYIYFRPETSIDSATYTVCTYTNKTLTASSKIISNYAWSFNGKDLNNSTNSYALENILKTDSGKYIVTGIDENGCSVTQDIILKVYSGTSFDIGDKEICAGESVELNVDGIVSADSFQWYKYNPEVYDTATVIVSSKKIDIDTEGTYYVMAVGTKNEYGCSSIDSVKVTVHDLPSVSLDAISGKCQGTSYTYDAGSGFSSYEWQDGSTKQTYKAEKPQKIYVTVKDKYGCSNSDTTKFAWKEVHVIDEDTLVACPQSDYTIELKDGLSNISWSFYDNYKSAVSNLGNNTSSKYEITGVDTLDAGLYIIEATEDGCDVVDTTNFYVVSTASINLGDDRTICNGENIQLNANKGFTSYEWYYNTTEFVSDNISVTAGSKSSTEYWTVYASYNYGECELESSVNVINVNLPTMSLQDYSKPCSGDKVYLTELIAKSATNSNLNTDDPANTLTYYWNGAEKSSPLEDIFISEPGTYEVSFSNKNLTAKGDTLSCYSSETTEVDYRDSFTMDLSDKLICPEETTTLDAPDEVTGYSELKNYQWVYLDDDGNAIDSCNANSSWENITSSLAGNYALKVQYSDSLCLASDTMAVVTKSTPSISIYGDTVIFEGESTILSTDYGLESYLWSTGATVESIDVTEEGNYVVTVVGQNDCSSFYQTSVVVLALPSFADISLNDTTLCHDDIYTSPAFGDSFEFSWSTKLSGITSSSSSISLTQTDSLYLTITDPSTGYTKNESAYIYFRPETTVDSKTINICAYTDYTFTASDLINGPYAWSKDGEDLNNSTKSYTQTNILLSDAGTYTVTGIDQYGCSVTQDFVLKVNTGYAFDLGSDKEICAGDSIQLSPAVSANSYNWYYNVNPEVTQSATAVSNTRKYYVSETGTYYVMAVETADEYGCSSVDSIKVTVNELPNVDIPDVSEQCQGTSYEYDAGDFSSYEWQDGSTNQTYIATEPQTVSVTVKDENGCYNADTTQYIWKDVNVFSEDTVVVCPESSYKINLEDGLSNIVWYFKNGETTKHLDNDGKDSYTISSLDSLNDVGEYIVNAQEDGCDVYDTLHLFAVATSSINLGDDRTICSGETIQLNANKGFTSYEWYYNTTEFVSDEPSVTAGSKSTTEYWTVYASFNYGECELESSVNVINVNLPSMTLQDYSQPCSGDTVYLTELITKSATNSNLNSDDPANTLTYYWNGAKESSPLEDLYISKSGTYTLSFSNKNLTTNGDTLACYSSEDTQTDYRELFTISSLSDKLLCPGETTTLEAPENVTTYSELKNYQWVHLDVDGNVDTSCAANSSWSDVGDEGDYVLRMEYTDSLCFDSDTLSLVNKEVPDVSISGDTEICSGDTTTLSTDYGYNNYEWSTGETSESINVSDSGDYILRITAQNNCVNSDTATLLVNELPVVTLTDDNIGLCNNSEVGVSVESVGYSNGNELTDPKYEWSTWETTSAISVVSEGDYSVTVTDSQTGCSNSDTASVYPYPITTIDMSGISTIGCSNEGVLLECPLSLSDITSYQWTKSGGSGDTPDENTDWTVYESGTYILSVTDANLCEINDSVSIVIYTSPTLELGNDSSVCISSSYELSSSGDFNSYLWSTGDTSSLISISTFGTNDYWLKVTDSIGCSISDTISITTVKVPSVSIPQPDTVCVGTQVELIPEVSGTDSYSLWWSTNTSNKTINVYNGTYIVTVTDEDSGCSNSDTVSVHNYDAPTVSLGNDQYICPSIDSLYISPEEDDIYSAYLWQNDKTTYEIVGDIGSINSVTVTDENGCIASDQVVLKYLSFSDTTFNFAMCQQDTTISLLDIDSDVENHTGEYYWYNDGSMEDYYTFSTSDTFRVSIGITLDEGETTCYYKQDTIIMDFYPLPVITALDTLIYQTVTLEMDNENPPYSYSMDSIIWQDDNSFEDLSGEGEYTVYVIDSNNCTTSQTFTLSDDIEINVPHFFTPNNDGYNDVWHIDGIERLPESVIRIYNRYGKLLKIYKASEDGWDGTYQNKPMPVTDYWYVIELKPINKLLKGHFTLKR